MSGPRLKPVTFASTSNCVSTSVIDATTASFAAALAAIEGEGTADRVSLAGLDPAGAADAGALSAEEMREILED